MKNYKGNSTEEPEIPKKKTKEDFLFFSHVQ
jgi:hypothetical protein